MFSVFPKVKKIITAIMDENDHPLLQDKIENNVYILSSTDRKRRQTALANLHAELKSATDKSDFNLVKHLIHLYYLKILACLNDSVEACREETINVVQVVVERFLCFKPDAVRKSGDGDELVQVVGDSNPQPLASKEKSEECQKNLTEEEEKFSNEFTSELVVILKRKFAADNSAEPSEEVRLHLLELLHCLLLKCSSSFFSSIFPPLLSILSTSLIDPYPDIKVISANLVSCIAEGNRFLFEQSGEILIPPLVGNMSHRHSKVRVATIQAVGVAILYGNSKSIQDVTGPLAERLFDQNATVREEVLQVATRWLLDLRDRYSYFARIIPLILSCLCDEREDTQRKALESWQRVGDQYYEENKHDERLKDKMNFLSQELVHYPNHVQRPNLGCRVLVQREMSKFLPALQNELFHWMSQVRVKSAQLLCTLCQHEEHNIVQHIPSLLPIVIKACSDQEINVRENVERAAEMIGYFVPPRIYCDLILPVVQDSCTLGHIMVLAAILKGSRVEELSEEGERIAKFLAQPHVCQTRDVMYQARVLSIVQSLLRCSSPLLTPTSVATQSLFTVLITVYALADQCRTAADSLAALSKRSGFKCVTDMFRQCSTQALESCAEDVKDWCVMSPWRCVFESLLCYQNVGDCFTPSHMDTIIGIFTQAVHPENEAMLILKMLLLLCHCLDKPCSALSAAIKLDSVLDRVIKDVLTVHLVWRAGKSQEALRTAAVAALRSCLARMSPTGDKTVPSTEDNTVSLTGNSLSKMTLEDNSVPPEGNSISCDIKSTENGLRPTMPADDSIGYNVSTNGHFDSENSAAGSTCNISANETHTSLLSANGSTTHLPLVQSSTIDFKPTIDAILPLLLGTLEDRTVKTRLFTVDCVLLLLERHRLKYSLTEDGFSKLYQAVLKRLDDDNDEVRAKSLALVTALFLQGVPEEMNLSDGVLSLVYRTLLLHLDDQNAAFQQLVFENLQQLGKLNPQVLLKYMRVESFRDKDLAQRLYQCFT